MNTRTAMTEEMDDRNRIPYHERQHHSTTSAAQCQDHYVKRKQGVDGFLPSLPVSGWAKRDEGAEEENNKNTTHS